MITLNQNEFFAGGNKNLWSLNDNGHLVTNAGESTLRKDEWELLTRKMIQEYQKNTTLINDVRSAGLTSSLGGLGTIIAQWQREGDITGAQIDMDARTQAKNDRPEYDLQGIPVPITHKSYTVHTRNELASQKSGFGSTSTRTGILAATKIAQSNELMLLDGVPGMKVMGNEIFGYRTHPERITGTTSANWATASGATVLADVLDIIAEVRGDLIGGEMTFYVAEDIWTNIQNDFSDVKGSDTILDRILKVAQVGSVKPARDLVAGEVLAVTLDANTIDLAIAQDTSNVMWNDISLFETEYKVFNALVPILMPTMAGRLGVAHFTKA